MKGLRLLYLLICCTGSTLAQDYTVSGSVSDSEKTPLSFVNVLVFEEQAKEPFKGTTTNEDGTFLLKNLEAKTYKLTFSFMGFETITKQVTLFSDKNLGTIILKKSSESLDETVVYAKQPTINRQAGKLIFNVENTSLSIGNSFDILKKTPGVLVIGDGVSIKNQPLQLFILMINGCIYQLLKQPLF